MRAYIALTLISFCALALFGGGVSYGAPPAKQRKAAPYVDPAGVIDGTLKAALAGAPKSTEYPESDAVCLLDLSEVELLPDGAVVETIRKAYKLFNQRGRSLAEINLSYSFGRELLRVVSARTIEPNGKVVPVRAEDMRLASPDQNDAMASDAAGIGFSLPAIQDNCVIDYTYVKTTTSPKLLPGQYAETWRFSSQYPVKLSRLILHAPASKALRYKFYNEDLCKPVVKTAPNGKTKTYVFERRDIKPLVPEPMMPLPMQVASHVEISSIGSWDTIGRLFAGLQRPQAKASPAIASTVAKLIAGKTTDTLKATAIYDWVVDNIRYVPFALSSSAYKSRAASEVYGKRYGDSKGKTNLLITMLGVAGIPAEPVLLSAGNPVNLEEQLPSFQTFNHCIALAKVEGKDVWLDATAPTCTYGDIPQNDRGAYALIAAAGKAEFKQMPPYEPAANGMVDHETLSLSEDGSADLTEILVMRGSFAQGIRATMRAITPAQREQVAKQMIQAVVSGAELKDYKLPDGRGRSDAEELRFSVHAPVYAQQADNLLLVPISAAAQAQNPFVQEKRSYPFYQPLSLSIRSDIFLTLPKGYVLSRLPADITLSSPLNTQRVTFKRAADGRSVTVESEITTRQGTAPVEAFQQMKDYYAAVIKLSKEKIVLKKIEP